jgi:gingipain R
MDGIYNSVFINYRQNKDNLTIGDYGDILVIVTDRDEDAIEPYIQWKKEKGFDVFKEVVATNTNVNSLIQQKYDENNDILFVQLVGDWDDIKSNLGPDNSPIDPQLGCVVGTDENADICIGRISANSAADVTIQVDKIINYEKNPEAGAGWYSSAIGIASDEGASSGDDGEIDHEHLQIIWDNKLDPFTYETYTPVYAPGATVPMISGAVNDGVSIINYTGHGSTNSWSTTGFSNSDIAGLTNENKLPWIVSVACVNGAFHEGGDCFAEAWVKKENGGAVMALMSTINQPWAPPMRGQDYMADIIIGGYDYNAYPGQNGISTTEQRTFTGPIIFNSFVLMISESSTTNDWKTVKTWTTFGDPSLQLRTAAPADINSSNMVVMVGIDFERININACAPDILNYKRFCIFCKIFRI